MKRLLMLALPLLVAGAMADGEVNIKGRLKFVDPNPEIILLIDTPKGLKKVSFGPAENWRGRMLWLDRHDRISVSGRVDPSSGNIIAEKVWVNGNHYMLPSQPKR